MLPSSTKNVTQHSLRCGKCLGYQPLKDMDNGEGRVEEIPQANCLEKVGKTISNYQCVWLGFFSLKHLSTIVGNDGICRRGAKGVTQKVQAGRTASLAGVSREGLTREILARHSCLHLA